MAHHQYGGTQMSFRSTPQNRTQSTEYKLTNVQRAAQEVKYHQPFQRLQRRLVFQKTLNQYCIQQSDLLANDNFALFDAVVKRGYMSLHVGGIIRYVLIIGGTRSTFAFSIKRSSGTSAGTTSMCCSPTRANS